MKNNFHGGIVICLMKFDRSFVNIDLMNDIEVINDEINDEISLSKYLFESLLRES